MRMGTRHLARCDDHAASRFHAVLTQPLDGGDRHRIRRFAHREDPDAPSVLSGGILSSAARNAGPGDTARMADQYS
jgi:hypothetical protein